MELRTGQMVERYRIEGVLGRGGLAVVYKARHTRLDTLHAVKVLQMPAEPLMQRLLQEGKAQAQLRHKNIVSVTDVLDIRNSPALVMEYVAGPTLQQLLAKQQLTLAQADALGRDIIRAVAHAHDYEMVHRDLKPANIMIATERGALIPKITDFGLAKLLDLSEAEGRLTRSGMPMGTPEYMAPEQHSNPENVDERADVYALGCILYELLTGKPPFSWDGDFVSILLAKQQSAYAPLSEAVPSRART